ncbi:MAG: hypothetical protein ACOCYP_09340 [Planctomycetota bacterium]
MPWRHRSRASRAATAPDGIRRQSTAYGDVLLEPGRVLPRVLARDERHG